MTAKLGCDQLAPQWGCLAAAVRESKATQEDAEGLGRHGGIKYASTPRRVDV